MVMFVITKKNTIPITHRLSYHEVACSLVNGSDFPTIDDGFNEGGFMIIYVDMVYCHIVRLPLWSLIYESKAETRFTLILVGGFNPSEKY